MTTRLNAEDVIEINNQISLYCLYADDRAFERVGQLLSDADIYVNDFLLASRSAATVTARFAGSPRPENADRRHVTTNVIITAEAADAASSVSYYTWIESPVGGTPQILQCGVYKDRFRKLGGEWRFIERRIVSDGAAPRPSVS